MKKKLGAYLGLAAMFTSMIISPIQAIIGQETKVSAAGKTGTNSQDITGNKNVTSSFEIDSQKNNSQLSIVENLTTHNLYVTHKLTDLFLNQTGDSLSFRMEGAVLNEEGNQENEASGALNLNVTNNSGVVIGQVTGTGDTFSIKFNDAIENYNELSVKYALRIENLLPTQKNAKGQIKIFEKNSNQLVYTIDLARDKPNPPVEEGKKPDGLSKYEYDATAWPGGNWNGFFSREAGGWVNGANWNPISAGKIRLSLFPETDEDGNPYPIRFYDYRNTNYADEIGGFEIWTRIPVPGKENEYTYKTDMWWDWKNYILSYNEDKTQIVVDVSSILSNPNKAIQFQSVETTYIGEKIFKPEAKDTIAATFYVELLQGNNMETVASRGAVLTYKPFLPQGVEGLGYGAIFQKFDKETNEPMAHISFDIRRKVRADGTATNDYIGRFVSNEKGIVKTRTNLNKNEVYEVKEVNTPLGYQFEGLTLDSSNLKEGKDLLPENAFPVYNESGYNNRVQDITGEKIWKNDQGFETNRPERITVELFANDVKIDEQKITKEDKWKYRFVKVPVADENGQRINYTVKEVTVPGYTTKLDGYNIVNVFDALRVSKVWSDNNNEDGLQPKSVTVQLMKNGEDFDDPVTLNEENDWQKVWIALPKEENGKKNTYTIKEVDTPEGYEAVVSKDSLGNFILTNKHKVEKVTIAGEKKWDDGNNQDGLRPEKVTVQLTAEGIEPQSQEVTAEQDWKFQFNNLPKFKDGKEIKYQISEVEVPEYATTINQEDLSQIIVTNTHETKKVTVAGEKIWNDDNDQDGLRPTEITVHVLANGKEVESQKVTEKDNWQYKFKDLPKFKEGKEITYTITENQVKNYQTEIKDFNIINSYTPGKTSMTVTKKWEDENNQDGIRPSSIKVQLKKNNKNFGEEVELNEKNKWTTTWNNLPQKEKGKEIYYTISEVKVADYKTTISQKNPGNIILTNTHTPEVVTVKGTKTWEDDQDKEKLRPEKIMIHLF